MSGIKHIEFWVSNLQRSLVFYQRIFSAMGWQQVDSKSFSDGESKIYFVEKEVVFQPSAGPRHICFLVTTTEVVDRVGHLLKDTKATIIRGPILSHFQDRKSYTVDFKDPDGYILEVATKSVVK